MYQQSSAEDTGKMKTPKMTKKHFQQPIFCKWLIHATLICNHTIAINACSRYWKN